jgi:hypothetical protein
METQILKQKLYYEKWAPASEVQELYPLNNWF